jgi:hypothetical protein
MLKGCFFEKDAIREIPIRDRTGKKLCLKLQGSFTPKGKSKKDKVPYRVGKVVWGQQSNAPDKVILIEELLWGNGEKSLRFCYRTQTHKKGLWWWGQFALMVPIHDIEELLQLAKENGLIQL